MNAWITEEIILAYQRTSPREWSPVPSTRRLEDRERAELKWWPAGRGKNSQHPPSASACHLSHPLAVTQPVQGFSPSPEAGDGLCCPRLPGLTPVLLPPPPFPPQQDSDAHMSAELALKCRHESHCVLAHFGLRSTTGIIQTENYFNNNLLPTALSALTSQRGKQLKKYPMMEHGKSGIHSR